MGDTVVLDIGKTNLKLARFAPDGVRLHLVTSPNPSIGGRALDVTACLKWFVAQLADLSDPDAVAHIMPIAHGAAFGLIGGDRLLLPVQDYETHIPHDVSEAYERRRPPFSESFSPSLPGGLNAGRQMFWLRRSHPAIWRGVDGILPLPQLVGWMLTGERASDVSSLACHTDLWAPAKQGFSSLVEAEGWTAIIPAPSPAWSELGTLRKELVASTGLAGVTVHVGAHDSAADLWPTLRRRDGSALLSTGTWVVAMAPGAALDGIRADGDGSVSVAVDGTLVLTARFMGGRLIEDGRQAERPTEEIFADFALRSADALLRCGSAERVEVSGAAARSSEAMRALQSALPGFAVTARPDHFDSLAGAAMLVREVSTS